MIERKPIMIPRIPILGLRDPIRKDNQRINWNGTKYAWLPTKDLEFLKRLSQTSIDAAKKRYARLEQDYLILMDYEKYNDCEKLLVPYYNRCVNRLLKTNKFDVLSSHGRYSRHWPSFTKTWDLIQENGYDYKIYLDAQFSGFINWGTKQDYPNPNMLYSPRAIKCYDGYIKSEKDRYEAEGWKSQLSPKADVTADYDFDAIRDSVNRVAYEMKGNTRRTFDTKSVEKANVIYDSWGFLSPEYLATQRGFLQIIGSPDKYPNSIQIKIETIQKILENPETVERLRKFVLVEENAQKIPTIADFRAVEI